MRNKTNQGTFGGIGSNADMSDSEQDTQIEEFSQSSNNLFDDQKQVSNDDLHTLIKRKIDRSGEAEDEPHYKFMPPAEEIQNLTDSIITAGEHSIVDLKLENVHQTSAKDIGQILHIKTLIRFYLLRESTNCTENLSNRDIVRKLISDLYVLDDEIAKTTLVEYYDKHKNKSKQRNLLSAVILISYINDDGVETTVPFGVSDSVDAYQSVNSNDPRFIELVINTHGKAACGFRDNHTEAALVVMLEKKLNIIKDRYGDNLTRIAICIDSRLSGCNPCVKKIQSLRYQNLGDIRISVGFNYAADYNGEMVRALSQTTISSSQQTTYTEDEEATQTSQQMASPILANKMRPLDPRQTSNSRSPGKTEFINRIKLASISFVSGSQADSAKDKDIIIELNNASEEISALENKLYAVFFSEYAAKSIAQEESEEKPSEEYDYYAGIISNEYDGSPKKGSSSSLYHEVIGK